jgi:5-methylcytosine-specific restriction endonuclease McrA
MNNSIRDEFRRQCFICKSKEIDQDIIIYAISKTLEKGDAMNKLLPICSRCHNGKPTKNS